MTNILQKNSPQLRQISKPVLVSDIGSKKVNEAIKKMSLVLESEIDGVALAAPQIGIPWRIFIISHKVFEEEENQVGQDLVFINPVITKLSRKKNILDEGCLSVRPIYGKVKRSAKATVEALDQNSKHFSWSASGLIAQIFQHEIDHLDGILFIDKATDLREIAMDQNPATATKKKDALSPNSHFD